MTEHGLHARQGMVHALLGTAAEQPHRVVGSGIHRLRGDAHAHDTAAQPRPQIRRLLGELPPHPVDDGGGIERPGCSQTRSLRSPRSPVSSTRTSVQTSPKAPRRAMNSSAAMRIPNAS